MPETNDAWAGFRSAIEAMNAQHRRRREEIREAIKKADVPMPPALLHDLRQLSHHEALDVLRDHPGFVLSERLSSYRTSLQVFETSVEDLLRSIQMFEERASDGRIFDRAHQVELERLEGAVQKELFAAASAAHALKDHSSYRVQASLNITGYAERLLECFGKDGLHDFVIGLRDIIHHIHMLKAGWHTTDDFVSGERGATFKVDRSELMLVCQREGREMNARGRQYLEAAPEWIDLRSLFVEYRRRAREFHAWISQTIEALPLLAVHDYEFCVKESRKGVARMWWKAMLGNWLRWPSPPNPYNHLDRYLTSEQLIEVYALPMKSEAQVDRVIELMDTDGACDEELRSLAYEFFRRAAT
jgi:hypothetical protein